MAIIQASIPYVEAMKIEKQACKYDPWYFVQKFVITQDEHDVDDPYKRFPPYDFMKRITKLWVDEPLFAAVKSRQIMMTWLMMALHFHSFFFYEGVKNFVISKKESDADADLRRALFIYERLPEIWKEENPVEYKFCHLTAKRTNSQFIALPSGEDQIRQHTATKILIDEAGLPEDLRGTVSGALPSVRGGGQLTLIGTPKGMNYFERIINDRGVGDDKEKTVWVGVKDFAYQKNKDNGFFALDLGYNLLIDAEIRMRGLVGKAASKYRKEWLRVARLGHDDQSWEREMERNFEITPGDRCFPKFEKTRHVRKLICNKHRPLIRGWDFGYHYPAVLFAQYDPDKRKLYILGEYMKHNIGLRGFVKEVLAYQRQRWPELSTESTEYEDCCDPAGTQVNDKSEQTSVEILNDSEIFASYRVIGRKPRLELIRDIINRGDLMVDETCTMLIRGFLGGYSFPENKEGRPEDELPKKDGYYDHLQDCLAFIGVNNSDVFTKPFPKKAEEPLNISPRLLRTRSKGGQYDPSDDSWFSMN